jgi:hypothetical protein
MRLTTKQQLIISNLKPILKMRTTHILGRLRWLINDEKNLISFNTPKYSVMSFPIRKELQHSISTMINTKTQEIKIDVNENDRSSKFYDMILLKDVPERLRFRARITLRRNYENQFYYRIPASEFLRGMFVYYDLWDEDEWLLKLNQIIIGLV